jgi:hypothetical protein
MISISGRASKIVVAQNAAGYLDALDIAFHQDRVILLEGFFMASSNCSGPRTMVIPILDPPITGLTTSGRPSWDDPALAFALRRFV